MLVFNLLLAAVEWWRHRRVVYRPSPPTLDFILAAHPGMTVDEIGILEREHSDQRWLYEPFVQFRPAPGAGRYLNVDPAGFRRSSGQGPWPLDPSSFNVFVFGGSTAFGVRVGDDETLASLISRSLEGKVGRRVRMYNFGRSAYASTQERILFEQLLVAGHVPNVAIFIDGLNDSLGHPAAYTRRLRLLTEVEWGPSLHFLSLLQSLPMGRAQGSVARRMGFLWQPAVGQGTQVLPIADSDPQPSTEDPPLVSALSERYLANKTLIEAAAGRAGCRVAFVWQPVPSFDYDITLNPLALKSPFRLGTYYEMQSRMREGTLGEDFLWCADLQRGRKGALYVDPVHYSVNLARPLAEQIADFLLSHGILPRS